MEQTLGKRIVHHRKRLGMTQDRLAEQLGVTAQAVSKWENDQACPDITMLPKLAEIFGITTDELLGISAVHQAEVVTEQEKNQESDGLHVQNGSWEFNWDGGRKSGIGLGLWVLLVGSLLLTSNLLQLGADLWDIVWPSALLIFGIFGIFPRFSFFRLGCSLFGGYYLLANMSVPVFVMGKELLLPICIVLFGLSLLMDAMKKGKPRFSFVHKGNDKSRRVSSSFNIHEDSFEVNASFAENEHLVTLPKLAGGQINLSFGELTVDLSGCEKISENCHIQADCSFGELTILVPRRWQVEPATSKAFASVEISGHPDAQPEGIIYMDCNVSFGEIEIEYI